MGNMKIHIIRKDDVGHKTHISIRFILVSVFNIIKLEVIVNF